jgi:DNA-binding NarL/FixJ family response regulator
MEVEGGGSSSVLADRTRISLVSHVRVHAECLAAQLRALDRLPYVTLARAEDCAPSLRERQPADLLLVDSSSVPIGALILALGVEGAVMLADETLKLVAYGLSDGDEASITRLASLGALGFVACDATFDELAKTVQDVLAGEVRCPPSIAAVLVRHFGEAARLRARLEVLSPLSAREREALMLVVSGLEYKAIAARMAIAVDTVRAELHRAYSKLGVKGKIEARELICFGAITSERKQNPIS